MADYPSHTPEGDCVFCKIISREIHTPGIFWQDENYIAFLSIFPNTEGYTVVAPKQHLASDVLEMNDQGLQDFILAAKTVSAKLKKHFSDVGRVGLMIEGMGIDHAHIKLFPMHGTDYLEKGEWRQSHSGIDKYFETYEGYFCSNDGPRAKDEDIQELASKLREV